MTVLRVGDRVVFDGAEHRVVALAGTSVRLVDETGAEQVVLLSHLVSAADFELVDHDPGSARAHVRDGLLDDLPPEMAAAATRWERHVLEIETGLVPDAPAESTPRPQYDPSLPMAERERAMAAELSAAGEATSVRTVQRMRRRYRSGGLRALVDKRSTRYPAPAARADPRLVQVVVQMMAEEVERSTGTRDRLRYRVERELADLYGPGTVAMPSKATFNRLAARLDAGRHTFGAASTRRSLAARPQGPYTVSWAARPGCLVLIDATPLDVLALFDDGIARRVELVAAVDVATRTICAAVLRPAGAKAVDASLLLARMLVPEPMRPGWAEAAAMTASRLPHRTLSEIDERMKGAAAKPVIVPEAIGCDRGKVFLSETFLSACRHLGISLQPSRPRTGSDDAVIERTFHSINTLFCQYVRGYVGRDVARRGRDIDDAACWSLAQLQDLLDQWVILGWQARPHDGLRGPDTGRVLSPNEMYAVLVAAAGYVPLMLGPDDYVELLPACWRAVNAYGIRVDGRTYDAKALNPLRRQHSGVAAKRGLWQVHYDPYDLAQVWVRDHRYGGFITATWTHLPMVTAPFADYTWRHARPSTQATGWGEDREEASARALADLLEHAGGGPREEHSSAQDRKVAARTRAAAASHRPPSPPAPVAAPERACEQEDKAPPDTVTPFEIFDPYKEAARRW